MNCKLVLVVLFFALSAMGCSESIKPSVVGELVVEIKDIERFMEEVEAVALRLGAVKTDVERLEQLSDRVEIIFVNFKRNDSVAFTIHNLVSDRDFRFYMYEGAFDTPENYREFYKKIVSTMQVYSKIEFKSGQ